MPPKLGGRAPAWAHRGEQRWWEWSLKGPQEPWGPGAHLAYRCPRAQIVCQLGPSWGRLAPARRAAGGAHPHNCSPHPGRAASPPGTPGPVGPHARAASSCYEHPQRPKGPATPVGVGGAPRLAGAQAYHAKALSGAKKERNQWAFLLAKGIFGQTKSKKQWVQSVMAEREGHGAGGRT